MIVSIKDSFKLIGISVISCCAVLVCTMFLNYYMDLIQIENEIASEAAMALYKAQVASAKVSCSVSGGCLLLTAVIMLLFYIRNYIDAHGKELGILKAMGYSRFRIAGHFWVFGMSVLLGCIAGYCMAHALMPALYKAQMPDIPFPDIPISFHPVLALCLIGLPFLLFSAVSVGCAYFHLKCSPLTLLRGAQTQKFKPAKDSKARIDRSFLQELKLTTLKSKKALAFFMAFSAFCFAAMTQMSYTMKDYSDVMIACMMLVIGLVLACTTLIIAVATVIRSNAKAIVMMHALGYSPTDCRKFILDAYRPAAYIGFALGTLYQYILLKIMITVIFKDALGVTPEYHFEFPAFLLVLLLFAVFYELAMHFYAESMKKLPMKLIMSE